MIRTDAIGPYATSAGSFSRVATCASQLIQTGEIVAVHELDEFARGRGETGIAATPGPWLVCWISFTRRPKERITSTERSVEPSSTTITSCGGNDWSSIFRIVAQPAFRGCNSG